MPSVHELWNESFLIGLRPDPILKVWEWAEANRSLTRMESNFPGPWRTHRTPYLRGIMDELSVTSPTQEIALMKGSQVGATECANNWIGYGIDHVPCSMLITQPSKDLAELMSKQRIAPLIESTDSIREKVKDKRLRDSGNTILVKEFPGGILRLASAATPKPLRAMPVRFADCEEVDEYPEDCGGQGDPLELIIKRTVTYRHRRKLFYHSTPTIKGKSRINKLYQKSDQRHYLVPCPFCKHEQRFVWKGILIGRSEYLRAGRPMDPADDKRPDHTVYRCELCGKHIPEHYKPAMMEQGHWKATAPGAGKIAGFHLSAFYSPWRTWADIAVAHLAAQQDRALLKTWTNHDLAEPFDEGGEAPDQHILFARREQYPAQVPAAALLITCGIDVQDDRIEAEAIGWGRGEESWGIERNVFIGATEERFVWDDLERWLTAKSWRHESGLQMPISCTLVDCGFRADTVYEFIKRLGRKIRLFGVRGSQFQGKPIMPKEPSRNNKYRVPVFYTGTDMAKERLYARLKILDHGPGYMHFPWDYDEDFFHQLTAEKIVSKYSRGFEKRVWEKSMYDRNEALDIRVYSMVALYILKPDWEFLAQTMQQRVDQLRAARSAGAESTPIEALPGVKRRRVISKGIQ